MDDPENLSADDDRLLALAVAIADGTPVNWSDHEPGASGVSPSAASPTASLTPALRVLEQIVRGHHELHEALDGEGSQGLSASETLLTEARRAAQAAAGDLLRVEWGPLIVLEKIGRGSSGDVYRAWDPRLHREVALKLVNDTSPHVATPAFEEGRRLARVRHPNVVAVFGAERVDNRVGIWMEYVRGRTLADEIAERGPLDAAEAARIGIEVCGALSAVHAAGLIHRDVKAQNVMRYEEGRIVLGDFGTGVEFDETVSVGAPQIAGTPLYLAPELFVGHSASAATDVYSVGVLLYFLVTGKYPARGRTLRELRLAHEAGERVLLGVERPDLPVEFVRIVDALVDPGPDRRYGTAASAEASLSSWLSRASGAGAPSGTPRRGVRSFSLVTATVLVGVVLAGFSSPGMRARFRSWAGAAFVGAGAPISRQIVDAPCTGRPSADGQWIACVESVPHLRARGGTLPALMVFSPISGETRVVTQIQRPKRILSAVISPDASRIAFAVIGPGPVEVRTIDVNGGSERLVMSALGEIRAIGLDEWSGHDQQLVTRIWRRNQTVAAALVSPESGAMEVLLEFDGTPQMFSRSSDGGRVAYDVRPSPDTPERDIRVCDVSSKVCETIAGHPAIDVAPIWTPDGRLLFNSDRAGTMGLWEVELEGLRQKAAPRLLRDTGRARMGVTGFGPDGLLFCTLTFGDFDVYSASLDEAGGREIVPVRLSPRAVDVNRSPVWSPDGGLLAYVSRRGPFLERGGMRIVIQSVADGREREFRYELSANMNRLAWSPDGRRLALRALKDGNLPKGVFGIHLIDPRNGNVLETLRRTHPPQQSVEDQISDIAWIDQGTMVFANTRGLGAFDVQTGQERLVWDAPAGVTVHGMALSPDSLWAAVAMSEGPAGKPSSFSATIVPIAGGPVRELVRVNAPEVLWMQTWSADGQSVFVTRWDGSKPYDAQRPQFWKIPVDGRDATSLPLTLAGLSEARIHPDGRRLAFTAGGAQSEFWMMTVR